jgi:hypothetical protein
MPERTPQILAKPRRGEYERTVGHWPTNGALFAGETPISIVGAGSNKTFFVATSLVSKDSSILIHSAHRTNTLLYGLTVLPEEGFRLGEPYFVTAKPGSSWVYVDNVVVQSLRRRRERRLQSERYARTQCLVTGPMIYRCPRPAPGEDRRPEGGVNLLGASHVVRRRGDR